MYVDEQLMDSISTIALTNLYTLGKKTQRIELIGFNWRNKEHIALLKIAKDAHTVFGYDIYMEMSFIRWLWVRIHRKKYWAIYRLKTPQNELTPTCGEFIAHICDANNCTGIFNNIYERYCK